MGTPERARAQIVELAALGGRSALGELPVVALRTL
jgi:hypothetical protein